MCSVNVMKKVVHILDLINSDPGVNMLVSSCFNVKYVDGRVFAIGFEDLETIVLLPGWRQKAGEPFRSKHTSVLDCPTCMS